jgi:hypothetical protein
MLPLIKHKLNITGLIFSASFIIFWILFSLIPKSYFYLINNPVQCISLSLGIVLLYFINRVPKWLKKLLYYSGLLIFALIFGYIALKGIKIDELKLELLNVNYLWILIGILISLVSHFIRATRANMLYKNLGHHVTITDSYYAVLIGYMMNYFVPRSGELARCVTLQKTSQMPVEKTLGTVVLERVVDIVIFFAIALIITIINFDQIFGFFNSYLGNQSIDQNNFNYSQLIFSIIFSSIFFLLSEPNSFSTILIAAVCCSRVLDDALRLVL